jgi:predicted alpha-1,2-mannosidase
MASRPLIRRLVPAALAAIVTSGLLVAPGQAASSPEQRLRPVADPTEYVNPFTGTKAGDPELNEKMGFGWGNGNTYPGAVLPYGMLQWSPDTPSDRPGGYSYKDNEITGFGLTHMSGAGCPIYGDAPIMPALGAPEVSPAVEPDRYSAGFRHADEHASPGRYSVRLDNGAEVELAATTRGGVGRFTFPAREQATLLVDAAGSVNGATASHLRVVGDDTIVGQVTSGRFCDTDTAYTIYFAYRFDRPFTAHGTWAGNTVAPGDRETGGEQAGGWVSFDTRTDSDVEASVGLSFTDARGAMANMRAEVGSRSFEQVAAAGKRTWAKELRSIRVAGGREEDLRTFYTALYHVMLGPTVFSDVDGRYRGFDDKIHRTERGHVQYAHFSGWDTYRTHIQLVTLLDPQRASDMAQSLVNDAQQSGFLPRIAYANQHTNVMVGDPSDPILASAYAFGARDFDTESALKYMLRGANEPVDPGSGYVPREGLREYLDLGYVPFATINQGGAAGITLEYTTSDFSIAQFARALGEQETAGTFMDRAQNWQHQLNPGTGFLTPRMRDGSFLPVTDPSRMAGWVEGSQAQYTWMVPYNLSALVTAVGGPQAAIARLDDHFEKLNEGSRSRHAFLGNEPNLVTPWAYHAAGAPWRTQEVVRRAQRELFSAEPGGLHGNDDLGAMSAWYVWTALGLFPAIPGRAELTLNTPLFPRATIHRGSGQSIRIAAPEAPEASYIQGVTVDGRAHDKGYLDPALLSHGGTVRFDLGSQPDKQWASAPGDGIPSFTEHQAPAVGAVAAVPVGPGETAETSLQLQGFSGGTVRWSLGDTPGLTVTPRSGTVQVEPGTRVEVPLTVEADPSAPTGYVRGPLTLSMGDGAEPVTSTVRFVVAPPGSILRVADNPGISDDAHPERADFNDYGGSYSAQQLAEAGLSPGARVTVDGVEFTWPDTEPSELDNVVAHGQRIEIPDAAAGASTLGFLGAALGGHGGGTGTVTYTDGTTSEFTLALSDWTLESGNLEPLPENKIVAQMPYRNYPTGPDPAKPFIFYASAPLDSAKTVASVTLPANTADHDLHVFSLAVGG